MIFIYFEYNTYYYYYYYYFIFIFFFFKKKIKRYDYLFFTTGLQFHPETLNKEFKELNGIFSGSEIESCIEFIDNISKSTDKNYVV